MDTQMNVESPQALDTHGLTELGYLILMDRYAEKRRGEAQVDDLVVAILDNDSKDMSQKRELARVTAVEGDQVTVQMIANGNIKTLHINLIDKPIETSPEQIWQRVARGIASVEQTAELQAKWQADFEWLLDDWKFVPGGRILTAAGTNQALSAFNCFVLPSPADSRGGIMKTLTDMAEIMSRGGGVGINVSTLRPKNAPVKGVNGRSSGAVSWAALYSYVTGLIEQAGSRRGALMVIMNDWHPDVMRFISSKREAGNIVNANISVGISDEFMRRVAEDDMWYLKFPDTSHAAYDTEWDGNLETWEGKGYPVIVYDARPAREIWNMIIESAWASAEPGMWFRDRTNNMFNGYYYSSLIATNPCGELPLAGWGVCNLGAINLAKMYDAGTNSVDWDLLRKTTETATRFLDNVNDWTPYFFEANKEKQMSERRIGLGIMGLAELLVRLSIRYGSDEGAGMVDLLFHSIAEAAYETSANLAEEKGSFPEFKAVPFLKSGYMRGMPNRIRDLVREKGIRNVTLITVAPTGTTGTLVNTSTGIEPFFSWVYYRKGRLGMHEERVPVVQEYLEAHPGDGDKLPDYFVTAMDLTPEEHVKIQAAAQRWVDNSISKTVNVPNDYTIEQTAELYRLMYDLGCKGGTIYRDGSRSEQVLTLKKDEPAAAIVKSEDSSHLISGSEITIVAAEPPIRMIERTLVLEKRGANLTGQTMKGATPYGSVFVTVNEDSDGNPFEVFITIGKSGTDLSAQGEGIGRLLSLSLQMQPANLRSSALKIMVDQLRGIGGARQAGLGANRVASFPDAVAKLLDEQYIRRRTWEAEAVGQAASEVVVSGVAENPPVYTNGNGHGALPQMPPMYSGYVDFGVDAAAPGGDYTGVTTFAGTQPFQSVLSVPFGDTCPECHNNTLLRVEGCKKCFCGYSEC